MNIRPVRLIVCGAALTLAGCGQVGLVDPQLVSQPLPADADETSAEVNDDQERFLIAWLASDTDHDGLPNGFELDFGLDLNDPTDGPDIDGDGLFNFEDNDMDGDGYVNATDPDIDGDGISNGQDDDIDGDGVPNEIDFDMDADGIRDEWDLDFDADGIEGEERIEVPEFVAQEFMDRATAIIEGDDGGDDAGAFEAYVKYLVKKGDASAQDKLAGLLGQLSGLHTIKTDGFEAELIVEQLAKRFDKKGVAKINLGVWLEKLDAERPGTKGDATDATDAVEVLFRQALAVQNPDKPGGHDKLQTRFGVLFALLTNFGEADLNTCSGAVNDLFVLPGDGDLDKRLEAFVALKEKFGPDAKLDEVMLNLLSVIAAVETELFGQGLDWDKLFKAIQTAPKIDDDFNDFDLIDHIVGELDDDEDDTTDDTADDPADDTTDDPTDEDDSNGDE